MRTLDLLKAFSDREITDIDDLIAGQKRKSLQMLYAAIKKYRKKTDIPGNEELFKKTFSKNYSSELNYLLRNELRLLNELIYDYLVGETFRGYLKKYKSSYYQWLARSFFDRKIKSAFEADIDRFIAYSEENTNPVDTSLMYDLKSLWMIYTQEKKLENLRYQIDITDKWKNEEIRRLKYRLREIEARTAYLEHAARNQVGGQVNSGDWRTPPIVQLELKNNSENDWFERYVILKKHSYQSTGVIRIEVLKQMLAIEEAPYYKGEYSTFNAQIATLNNLAIEYILSGDYREAEIFMETAISRCEQHNHPLVSSNLQNYLAIQMPLKQYQKGIDIYEKYEKDILASRGVHTMALYRSYCYLFINKPDEALTVLPTTLSTRHDQVFNRMAYIIAFYLRGQIELALNECRNARKFVNATEQADNLKFSAYNVTFHWTLKLFNAFLKAMEKDKEKRTKEMLKIKAEIWADKSKTEVLLRTEFPLLWLWREIEKQLPANKLQSA